jgi:hypothetical protein
MRITGTEEILDKKTKLGIKKQEKKNSKKKTYIARATESKTIKISELDNKVEN